MSVLSLLLAVGTLSATAEVGILPQVDREAHVYSAIDVSAAYSQAPAARHGNLKSVSSLADLAGEYVMTYETLSSGSYDGGCAVSISVVEGTDSIAITDFWEEDVVIKARVDLTAMTLSIPNQVMGYNSTYGYYDLALCTSTGSPDRTTELAGTINSDGTISISSWWGAYVMTGDYADQFFGAYYNTEFELANATMTYSVYSSGTTTTYTCPMAVSQSNETSLTVKNFYGVGGTITISLDLDSIPTIGSTEVVYTNSYGSWYLYTVEYASDYSGLSSYSAGLTCDKATDSRTISWGEWNMMCTYGGYLYWTGVYFIDGKIETDFDIQYPAKTALSLQGDGTADSPYLISTTDEWNNLASYMYSYTDSVTGKYFKLTADLDFSSTTIKQLGFGGTEIFNGSLDGNGKTVKGISLTTTQTKSGGLIYTAGSESYIHDLTVEGEVSSAYNYTGGVVGYLYGSMSNVTGNVAVSSSASYSAGLVAYCGSGVTLTNCVNNGALTTSGQYGAGLVAYLSASSVLTDCANNGAVTSSSIYCAGVVARSYSGVTYTRCCNTGAVTVSSASSTVSYAAGIVSYAYYCTMTDCYNTADITVPDEAGGATGILYYMYATSSTTSPFTFSNCWNSGNVTAGFAVSGIVGSTGSYTMVNMDNCWNTGNITSNYESTKSGYYVGGVGAAYCRTSTYTDCWNSGKIVANGIQYVGGVFGYYKGTGSSSKTSTFTRCYNTGDIETSSQNVGGVIGYMGTYCYVDSCYNTGDITASCYAGGISSQAASATTSITSCYNTGDITISTSRAGGILGSAPYRLPITDCFNTGDIATTGTVQGTTDKTSGYGIGGILGLGATIITNAYNTGTITGVSRIGGIVGSTYKTSTTIYPTVENVYSTGKISAPADSCGNIIGNSIVANTTVWTTASSLTNSYYLTANNAVADTIVADTTSVGLSYAEMAKLNLGDSWTAGDDYTYPRIASLAGSDYAIAWAAAVVPADGDSYTSITQGFYVGAPDGVTWSASPAVVEVSGNTATFTEAYTGTLTMTATCGDAVATTELTCAVTTVGVNNILGDDCAAVVSEKFYTVGGAQVAEPANGKKSVYIVVRTLSDGTTTATKEIR